MMLAGAQLGITLCTLGLGALAKPTVAELLGPLLDLVGLPEQVAYVVAFIVAVAVVGLLHVVVGEMAPKSWAISHPERSAILLAMPFRVFTRVARPVLITLNGLANACLRLVKVEPQDELAQVHGPLELRMLLDSSREHGTIMAPEHQLLTAMLRIQSTTVAQVMVPIDEAVSVSADASASTIEQVSRDSGRSRLLVTDERRRVVGVVHVRDAVRATTAASAATASMLMTAPHVVPADWPVARAVQDMRATRTQLAVVGGPGETAGVVALEDLLEEIIGEFDDETDPIPAAVRRTAPDGD
jgi:CBS domain containing-hemolysin-like protein